MPRAKAKKRSTVEEKKLVLWAYCLEHGWVRREQPADMNCLYNTADTKERMRMRFKTDSMALEVNRPLSDEEKKICPHKTRKWVVLEQGGYAKVEISDNGLIFAKAQATERKG